MPVPARSDKAAGAASELGVEEEDDQSEVDSMDCEEEENEGGVEEGIEGGDPQENEDKKKATAATPPETAKKRKEGADAATAAGRDPSKKVKGTKKGAKTEKVPKQSSPEERQEGAVAADAAIPDNKGEDLFLAAGPVQLASLCFVLFSPSARMFFQGSFLWRAGCYNKSLEARLKLGHI
jgi:hypothetical protein